MLEEQRRRIDLLETHKIMHDLERIPADSLRELIIYTIRRGHNMELFKERSRREPRRNFFSQRVAIPWNALPEKVVSSKTTLRFKIKYNNIGPRGVI